MDFLFEVSWEVCNKVGGIYTVIRSKIPRAQQEFGDSYYLIGPLMNNNPEFKETQEPEFDPVRKALEEKNLRFKIGRWKVPGEPKTILIDFQDRYDPNTLLYSYWRDFGIDSYGGSWDYIEPNLFSTACAEAIEAIQQSVVGAEDRSIAHFHEWMMGGGILHLKKHCPAVGTVFTTHATVLGRCMAGFGRDIHHEFDNINPLEEAKTYGVSAKHSMEACAAREADVFTTISQVTAREASAFLGKTPVVVENGLNISDLPNYSKDRAEPDKSRAFLFEFAKAFLQKDLPNQTQFWVTSGRYEYHNKGYDILLESLGQLDRKFRREENTPPIVVLFLVLCHHKGVRESVTHRIHSQIPWEEGADVGLTTHRLDDEQNDPIIKACTRLNLKNRKDNKIHVIFSPAYLDGHDGILDKPYEQILTGCDLGIFPSFYDPWGYTPLESITRAVPTVTTDLAGFGDWAEQYLNNNLKGVFIVPRKGRENNASAQDLTGILDSFVYLNSEERSNLRAHAYKIAKNADWNNFFKGYVGVYQQAANTALGRSDLRDSAADQGEVPVSFTGAQHSETPRFRHFTAVSSLPKSIKGLKEIANNLWWSWNPDARELFSDIETNLWLASDCNPVQLLNDVSDKVLNRKAEDKSFLKRYKKIYSDFTKYMNVKEMYVEQNKAISQKNPIAYFSLEYGLHECLPIYSGGLGVLSGDHMKAASDLNLPLIGIGLFYRQGYFTQYIDREGNQREEYPELDCATLPVKCLLDDNGKEVRISVRLPGRNVAARIWIVQVGRIKIYLFDSDVEENEPGDRQLTSQLYGGDRRTRIKQEILISLGGVRLIKDILGLAPAVFHLNEGHCAFLVMERIHNLMKLGLNFAEAREAVKASTVFTTHTPVPAGNEAFDFEVLGHYMRDYIGQMGINWEQFVSLGKEHPHSHEFSMTVLALRLSSKANAVAKLHGKVSRDMWKNIWKGVNVDEVPIFSITNGIHLQTFCSPSMRKLFDDYLDIRWGVNEDDPEIWAKVDSIPDKELWEVKQYQKRRFIGRIKNIITQDYSRRGEDPQLIRETLEGLSADYLTIGFARRFATYKRGALFLRDLDRIKRIVANSDTPVQIILAGKAHPADQVGKDVIKEIVNASRSHDFRGRVIYLENYNMGIGRLLTRGVDVWMNNPIRPMEASGTSGMKVGPNGGLNFSILDGWWDEAFDPDIGWEINPGAELRNRAHQDEIDNRALLDILENDIIPLYYDKNGEEYSLGWLKMMKHSIMKVSSQFNTIRMVKEYYSESYLPTAIREQMLQKNDYKNIRELTAWKRLISTRFSTVQIPKVEIRGISSDDLLEPGGELEVEMYIYPGKLAPEELQAEFVVGLRKGESFVDKPEIIQFKDVAKVPDSEVLKFSLTYSVNRSGNYLYAVRVVPIHPLLSVPQETGLMCWG